MIAWLFTLFAFTGYTKYVYRGLKILQIRYVHRNNADYMDMYIVYINLYLQLLLSWNLSNADLISILCIGIFLWFTLKTGLSKVILSMNCQTNIPSNSSWPVLAPPFCPYLESLCSLIHHIQDSRKVHWLL